jgi:hypothetical protein
MIYVTKEARQELKNILPHGGGLPETFLRIMDRGQGKLELDADMKRDGDQVVESDGEVLLIAGPRFASDIDNVSLDAYETSDGHRLVICEEIVNQSSRTVTVNWVPLPQVPVPA